ncbi:Uncharacterized protein TPAR_04301 [Tolypocladium paradoxum]|uniref:Uncharacterized protein n=1 Tax=Tolypocladium paradoxum TaxID=94208 RepID=A0A2S4KZ67_9HYPO|nr:Uncharacterized protein TPAR_04301 [Tolypocladium paradoxum]
MTSTQLPPLNFGDGGLRISLFRASDVDVPDVAHVPDVPDVVFAELDGGECEEPRPNPNPVAVEEPPEPSHGAPPIQPPVATIPVHPIPSLQDAFTESLDEVTNGTGTDKPKLRELGPRARRELLLGQDKDAAPFDATWRYRKGQKQHELFKLIGQISFGVYLLLNGMANSNAQVISILQGHIDEVDEFLEVTLEDLDQATEDLNGRIVHLKLPLSNIQVFEELLEDRNFRCEILEGNEKIDHVLSRTNAAMKQWDDDVDAGLQCIAAFTSWLNDEKDAIWRMQRPDVADVFDAMTGNAEGWLNAFDEIHDRTQDVNNLVIRLTTIIAEMEKKAGEAAIPPFSAPSHASHGSVSGGKPVPVTAGASSRQSHARLAQWQQPSIRSVSTLMYRPTTAEDTDAETIEFPLPGHLPLLPSRSAARHAPKESVDSRRSDKQASLRSASSPESGLEEIERHSPSSDEPLYVLQPRAYTPQPPEPMPPPMLKEAATITPKSEAKAQARTSHVNGNANGPPKKRGSIRHRVSLKTNLPDAIRIPRRSMADTPVHAPSPKDATPRTAASQPFDSAYGSDVELHSRRQGSNVGSDYSMSPPVRAQVIHSPRSDQQQYYHPVRASPHSPLQQRPHTAAGPRASQPRPQHLRNQPSQLGGMSTLSNVTMATYDERAATPSARTLGGERTQKKKKSAFGWFKKAFSLDDEERAAFEARRATAQKDRYYESNSPKFLDGRRIR